MSVAADVPVAVDDAMNGFVGVVRDREQIDIGRGDVPLRQQRVPGPGEHGIPVRAPEQHHGEVPDLVRALLIIIEFAFMLFYYVYYPYKKSQTGFLIHDRGEELPPENKTEPSFHLYETKFLWRGPTWIPINWWVQQCYLNYGFVKEANQLADSTTEMVEQNGFREYYNPETGKGYGAKDFTWDGLVVDMKYRKK